MVPITTNWTIFLLKNLIPKIWTRIILSSYSLISHAKIMHNWISMILISIINHEYGPCFLIQNSKNYHRHFFQWANSDLRYLSALNFSRLVKVKILKLFFQSRLLFSQPWIFQFVVWQKTFFGSVSVLYPHHLFRLANSEIRESLRNLSRLFFVLACHDLVQIFSFMTRNLIFYDGPIPASCQSTRIKCLESKIYPPPHRKGMKH